MFEQTQNFRFSGIAALALGLAAAAGPAARAQAPDSSVFRSQDASGFAGNVVGGGAATILGGGDDMVIAYSGAGAGSSWGDLAQPRRRARLLGGTGDGPEVEYLDPPSSGGGREAWITGGGDDGRLLYASPYAATTASPAARGR